MYPSSATPSAISRRLLHRDLEELPRLIEEALAEESAPHLEHEIEIVAVPELEDAAERLHARFLLPELHQCLAQAGEGVLVLRIEHQSFLEAPSRPRIFLTRETGVPHPNVELYRMRVERQPFAKHLERLLVLPLVIELMGALVVLFGTQERGRHVQRHLQPEG